MLHTPFSFPLLQGEALQRRSTDPKLHTKCSYLTVVQLGDKNREVFIKPDTTFLIAESVTYPTLEDGSQLKTAYIYDTLNRLGNVTNTKGATILSSYTYGYDDNGNIVSKTDTVNQVSNTTTYTYDALNRLKTIIQSDGSTTIYSYDLEGNRKTLQDSKMSLSLTDTSFVFDLFNQLTSISGTYTTTFAYDPSGMRYKKTTGTQTVQYHYDAAGNVISEADENNTITANYIRGDRLLAKEEASTGKLYYYLYNGHGDVVQIVDTSGIVVNQYQYDEWGNITSQTEGIENSFKYAGEQFDNESGLYYLRARYYDPSVGRFISEDTYEGKNNNPLSLNMYIYVENNPLRWADPSGHSKDSDNSELAELVKPFGDEWERLDKYDCGGISLCEEWRSSGKIKQERLADNIRVSYYVSRNQSIASDVKYLPATVGDSNLVTVVNATDGNTTTQFKVGSDGYVQQIDQDQSKYTYWFQEHKATFFESALGNSAKTASSIGLGYLTSVITSGAYQFVQYGASFGVALGTDVFMPPAPSPGEVRTMIYRTDKETGTIENMIIVTHGQTNIEYRYWQVYH